MGATGSSPKRTVERPARRRKHVPQRTCVACRRTMAKRDLIRIVHTLDGTVEVDPKGKRAGRGAYLCHQQECWEAALGQGILGRALRVRVAGEQLVELRAQLASLVERALPAE